MDNTRRLGIFSVFIGFVLILFLAFNVAGLSNPAASYCEGLGYNYNIVKDKLGEHGVCVINNIQYNEWDFFSGKVGQKYNYCGKQGLQTVTKSDGKNSYSKDYAVCISKTKSATETQIPYNNFVKSENITLPKTQKSQLTNLVKTYSYPNYFDWRNVNGSNYITPAKNQLGCGICGVFSIVALVEAQRNIETNNPDQSFDLSEQDILSCSGILTCNTGTGSYGLSLWHIRDYGIVDEGCFPYVESQVACSNKCSNWQSRLTFISNIELIWNNGNSEIWKDYLINGPVSGEIYIGGYFENDVYICNDDGSYVNHAVLYVGYNETGKYWIAKNSWGSTWNGDGYFKIAYGNCSVAFQHAIKYFECQNGQTQNCAKQQGVCANSQQTCSSNHWQTCNYNSIPGYQETETLCDGKDNDCDGEVDEGGICAVCHTNSDCGTNGLTGILSCDFGLKSVLQTYRTYTCNNPGLISASCSHSDQLQINTTCGLGNMCSNGACQSYNQACVDSDGLNNNLKGSVIMPKLKKTKTITGSVVYNTISEVVYTDSCDSKGLKLTEYYCSSGKMKKASVKCNCMNGVCV